jgi:Spx/MgsR family transcriptional regulator
MKLYGIPNCTTVKKARAWLEEHGIPYEFHDYKKQGVPAELMLKLMGTMGWEALVNRNGPTWRKLPDATKAAVKDAKSALAVMEENASVIKRPIAERDGQYRVGFSEADYTAFFKK